MLQHNIEYHEHFACIQVHKWHWATLPVFKDLQLSADVLICHSQQSKGAACLDSCCLGATAAGGTGQHENARQEQVDRPDQSRRSL